MLIIFDLDGVVYCGKRVIHQAPETIKCFRERGHRIYFLTNNSALTREGFQRRLSHFGIRCVKEEIMSSAFATARFLKRKGYKGNVFVIGGPGLRKEMEKAGFKVVKNNCKKIDFVVVGMDRHFRYHDLYTAQQAILKGALFIATNADPTYPVEGGVLPGAGTMVSAIRTASLTVPIVVGKPNTFILKEILREAATSPAEAILVGDRLETDISLGKRCGLRTVLVLTGITRSSDLKRIKKSEKPDYVIKDISGLLKLKEFDHTESGSRLHR